MGLKYGRTFLLHLSPIGSLAMTMFGHTKKFHPHFLLSSQRGWSLSQDGYYSFTSQQQRTEEVTIPSTELAQQVIEYARQLEMIV